MRFLLHFAAPLLWLAALAPAPALAGEVLVTVDAEHPAGPVNPLVFGQNFECADSRGIFSLPPDAPAPRTFEVGYAQGYWDPVGKRPAPGVVERMKSYPFGALRYPGGCLAHNFRWKDTIGPIEERGAKNWAFGVDEYLALCRALDCEPQFTVTDYAFEAKDIPQDAADLVEYLNMPATPQYPWAQRRAANGHPEPYGVKYFEIGNESDHGNHRCKPSRRYSPAEYADYFNATVAAMKKVDPSIRAGVVSFRPLSGGGDEVVMAGTAQAADFTVIHTYIPRVQAMKPAEAFVGAMSANAQLEHNLREFHRKMAEIAKPMPVAFTEFNINSPDPGPKAYRYSFLAGMQSTELFCKFLQPENKVELANYWLLLNGLYGVVVTLQGTPPAEYTGELIERKAVARFFETLRAHTGAEVLPVSLDGMPTVNAPASPGVLAARGDRFVPGDGPYVEQPIRYDLKALRDKGRQAEGSAGDRTLRVRLDAYQTEDYPVFGFVDRPADLPKDGAWQVEVNFEARFVPDDAARSDAASTAKLGFGMMDTRGWNATRCASAVYGVSTVREWTRFTGRLSLLDDSWRLALLVRLEGFNGPLSGSLEFRDLRVGARAAGHFPAYPALSAFATRSADGGKLHLLVFNRTIDAAIPVNIRLDGFAAGAAQTETLYQEDVGAVEYFPVAADRAEADDGRFRRLLPPHSLTAFTFERD